MMAYLGNLSREDGKKEARARHALARARQISTIGQNRGERTIEEEKNARARKEENAREKIRALENGTAARARADSIIDISAETTAT